MIDRVESMESRIERLERLCRRSIAACVALAALLATVCLSSAMRGEPETLRARKIEVLGEDGKARIVLAGELGAPDGNSSGCGIFLVGDPDDAVVAGWTAGRARDEAADAWQSGGDFWIETSPIAGGDGAAIRLFASDGEATVKVGSDLFGHASLRARKGALSLQFRDEDPDGESDEDDPLRVSLELVDGAPALRALDAQGQPLFEER